MNLLIRIAAPVVVLGAGIGGYFALHATKPAPEEADEPPRVHSVFVERVRSADVNLDVVSQGEVRPRTEVAIVAQVAGRVVAVSEEFTEGGQVIPGRALLTIEDTDHRLALGQAEAAVADADLALQRAYAAADVARTQLGNKADPTPLALHEPQIAQALAQLEAARGRLAQAELDLERTRVSLPFDGRVTSTEVDVGQYVTPGTVVGRAFATDVVEVRVPFTDAQLASLGLPIGFTAREGDARDVELSAVVGGQQQHWAGRLVRLDAAIDPSTRLVYGIAEVTDPYGTGAAESGMPLAVGLYVEATIAGRPLEAAHVIPRDALRAGNQVFVVDDEGVLQIRRVGVTHSTPEEAVIDEGLMPGERVVVSSIRNPIQGMRLNALSPSTGEALDGAADLPMNASEATASIADASETGEES